jgi:hypothetical protein
MLGTVEQQAFLIGAALVLVFQAAKFSQFNAADPNTSRYIALLPGTKVRDFAGPYGYYIGLAAFLGASFVLYALGCHVSPDIIKGIGRFLESDEAVAKIQMVPYPLYVAFMFMGLTQPFIPGFAQIGDAQRKFFHDRIKVPTRVIHISESLINAIESRSASKRRLAAELKKLASGEFVANLQNEGDIALYRQQLEQLRIEDEGALRRMVRDSSVNELRKVLETLVLTALVSVMRRSGPKSLIRVAESLGAPRSPTQPDHLWLLIRSLISSTVVFGFGLLVIAVMLSSLNEPVLNFFKIAPDQGLWPNSLRNVGKELWAIVPPIFLCLMLAVSSLVPSEPVPSRRATDTAKPSTFTDLVEFAQSSAAVLGICMVLSVLIKIGQLFYEYGTFNLPPEARSVSVLILPLAQSFIPIAVCLFSTWYLASCTTCERRGLSFKGTLLTIAVATTVIAWIYGLVFVAEYLQARPAIGHARDYVLFIVLVNVLVSLCAFASTALFFKYRRGPAKASIPTEDAPRPARRRTRRIGSLPARGNARRLVTKTS